jgi:methionine biosynthesis protein MetW
VPLRIQRLRTGCPREPRALLWPETFALVDHILRVMPTSRESTYYDEYWSTGGFSPVGHKAHGTLLAMLEQNIHPMDSVLDVGCGDGSKVGDFCECRSASYQGVDVSERAVALARMRGLNAQVIEDASALPFDDGTFDVVVCCEVLEHLFAPFESAAEARRVLRTGGRYVVTVPNVAYWRGRLDLALLGRWHPGGDDRSVEEPWRDPHVRFFTPRSMRAMLESAGFAPVATGGFHDENLFFRVPALRRLSGGRQAGRLTKALARWRPMLFGFQVFAVATAP